MVTAKLPEKVARRAHNEDLQKDLLAFLAGAEAVHTLAHGWLGLSGTLPIIMPVFPWITITPALNAASIVVNAVFTLGLLYWATRLKRSTVKIDRQTIKMGRVPEGGRDTLTLGHYGSR